jgi:3',5'-cyclic AMP phosphodiesterase CpdA
VLLWHVSVVPGESKADWKVEVKTAADRAWRTLDAPQPNRIAIPGNDVHLVYRALLTGLVPGGSFQYRVSKDGRVVFESTAQARKSATQSYRFALFGDCAQYTGGETEIAYQVAQAKPDFLFVTGDIAYSNGRVNEYRDKFFPIYNTEKASPAAGAPLLRVIPFIAAPGNHDTALANFERFTDALAYFYYWDQPLNGPSPVWGAPKSSHVLTGHAEAQPAFREAAGERYPRMANFSFNYGNAHWTVLDSNLYMDWTIPALREWVARDLASDAARAATWRFVGFHHPGFNSSTNHFADQWMRVLSPVFEAGDVDLVFAGHVHNYQRSFPLTFAPKPHADGKLVAEKGEVDGDWKFDKEFGDGAVHTKPKGVIYIVSGAGGAGLYNVEREVKRSEWQPFTNKYVADRHSFSLVDIDGKTLNLRQVDEEGHEVDAFRIVK